MVPHLAHHMVLRRSHPFLWDLWDLEWNVVPLRLGSLIWGRYVHVSGSIPSIGGASCWVGTARCGTSEGGLGMNHGRDMALPSSLYILVSDMGG